KTVLNAVHATARGLHKAGLLPVQTMREFDLLCLPKIRDYSATQIKRIRKRNQASQAVFAAYLNTSTSTVQKWERGEKKPHGPSLKLLSVVDAKGLGGLAKKPRAANRGPFCTLPNFIRSPPATPCRSRHDQEPDSPV